MPPSSLTPSAKIALFRSLFRGREDVFPTLWVNAKSGRKGYAPRCANEWVRGVCDKPRVKCGACPNQAFVPVAEREILAHLQGRHVMGVYPLLPDETCWLLATDFDKESWQEDVGAFRETCRALDLPVAVERSRSGQGAHAWFFFTAPVTARIARTFGCSLLTQTMARRHQMRLASYDRLFPNQDAMPKGGFGNLIALPLQHAARAHGNTEFVDEHYTPHPDQWSYLAALPRLTPSRVEAMAAESARKRQVLSVRFDDTDAASAQEPWTRLPSGNFPAPRVEGLLPREVHGTLAQRLFVEQAGQPSGLIHRLKRLACFQNPEFYRKQAMRLSTSGTPRVISCAETHADHLALPRGCLPEVENLLSQHNVQLVLDDRRVHGADLPLTFRGQLTDQQTEATRALLAHDVGVLVAPPGAGKTVMGAHLIAARRRSTLVLVHRKPLLEQWVAQLSRFLGMSRKQIGRIGGGRQRATGVLDVAMVQSVVRGGAVADEVAKYGHVLVDECHHVPAVSFERVLAEVRARYVTGLTATPYRRDGHQPILTMQCGPVRHAIEPSEQVEHQAFGRRIVARETEFRGPGAESGGTIQEVFGALVGDVRRNRMIVEDIICALAEGRSPLVLTERRDHLEELAKQLGAYTPHVVVLHGGMSERARREALRRLAAIPAREERVLIATGRFIGEGFDDERLDTLFLTMPVAWRGTLVQYAGRLHRAHHGKFEVRIYDYVDGGVPVLARMFAKRQRGYRALGYQMDEGVFAFTLDGDGAGVGDDEDGLG